MRAVSLRELQKWRGHNHCQALPPSSSQVRSVAPVLRARDVRTARMRGIGCMRGRGLRGCAAPRAARARVRALAWTAAADAGARGVWRGRATSGCVRGNGRVVTVRSECWWRGLTASAKRALRACASVAYLRRGRGLWILRLHRGNQFCFVCFFTRPAPLPNPASFRPPPSFPPAPPSFYRPPLPSPSLPSHHRKITPAATSL